MHVVVAKGVKLRFCHDKNKQGRRGWFPIAKQAVWQVHSIQAVFRLAFGLLSTFLGRLPRHYGGRPVVAGKHLFTAVRHAPCKHKVHACSLPHDQQSRVP